LFSNSLPFLCQRNHFIAVFTHHVIHEVTTLVDHVTVGTLYVVEFMGSKLVIYSGWPSWNSADCCNVYLSGTNKMHHLCIFIVIFSPTCFSQQTCYLQCDISVTGLQSDQMCQITPQSGNSYDCWLEFSVG
jgi:hypothetical protein